MLMERQPSYVCKTPGGVRNGVILSHSGGRKFARVWQWPGVCLISALPTSGVSWLVLSRHRLQLILSIFIRNVHVLPLPPPIRYIFRSILKVISLILNYS